MRIGLLLIATNRYLQFVEPLLDSVKKYFLPGHSITPFLFTNHKEIPTGTILCPIEHRVWPYSTLHRYHFFTDYADKLKDMDYLYYSDVDMRFVDIVGDEVLGELVATEHPGFYNKDNIKFTYERRPTSNAYIALGMGRNYFAGGFLGGKSDKFLSMSKTCKEWIDQDATKGIIPIWHDESASNKYFFINRPTVILNPSYCYPEKLILPFPKKLLALDKDHKAIRS